MRARLTNWIASRRFDYALAVILGLGGELELWTQSGSRLTRGWAITAAVMAITAMTVAIRRTYPTIAGLGAGVLAMVLSSLVGPPNLLSYLIAWSCAMYGLAVWSDSRRFLWTFLALATVVVLSVLLGFVHSGELQFVLTWFVLLLLTRQVIGDRERRARLAERERDVAAREAVVAERARIARELHDIVAHDVSMIVLQAGGERRALATIDAATEPTSQTADVLRTIEETGRNALGEMRRLVDVLRSDAARPLAPETGLAELPTLIKRIHESGLPVELHVQGSPRSLPAGLDLSAYRIVQEALTNALKHGGGGRTDVWIRYQPEAVELEIQDVGGTPVKPVDSGGHGLVGMRERVELYGGRLETGSAPDGGFAVRAILPTG